MSTQPAAAPVEPNGCGVCGRSPRSHAVAWHATAGYHTWSAPTDEQLKNRMLARAAAR